MFICFVIIKTNKQQTLPGGTPLYKPNRYVPPHRVGFLRRFGLKTYNGYTVCPFWSGIGCGFRGNYRGVWTYLSFQFQMRRNMRIQNGFEEFVFLRSNLSSDNIIST